MSDPVVCWVCEKVAPLKGSRVAAWVFGWRRKVDKYQPYLEPYWFCSEHWAIEKRSGLVDSRPGPRSEELRARLWTERAERRADWKVLAAAVNTSELGQAALKTLERAGAAALDEILTSLTNADPSQWKLLVELAAKVGGDGIYEQLFKMRMIPRSPKHKDLHCEWAEVLRWIAIQAQPLGVLRAKEHRFRRELVAPATPRSHRRLAAFSLSLIDGAENRAVLLDYLRRAGRHRSAILEELTASKSDCARDVLREWDEISGNRLRREAQAEREARRGGHIPWTRIPRPRTSIPSPTDLRSARRDPDSPEGRLTPSKSFDWISYEQYDDPQAEALVRKLSLRPRFELELMHPEKSDALRQLEAMGSSASGLLLAGLATADIEGKGSIALLLGGLRHAPAIAPITAELESLRDRRDFDAVRVKGAVLGALEKFPVEDLLVAGIEAQLQSASADAAPEIREAARKLLARLRVSAAQVPWSQGARTWEEFAENFIALQVEKKAPDFGGFGRSLERFTPEQKHGAWHRVAFAFEEKGDKRRAVQCFVEALAQDPDSRSTAWRTIRDLLALPDGDSLGRHLSAVCDDPMGATGRATNAQLVAELRGITGAPG